jgi:Uma2 family endonuclease
MATPARKLAGWDDLLDVPEGFVGEIVDGEVVAHPRPGGPHTEVASDLGGLLQGPFQFGSDGGPRGWRILDEPRIAFGSEIRVPDLAGWHLERYVRPESGPFVVAPDWICEVLSPSTAIGDRTRKLPLYARHAVSFLWLVDPVGCSLEVYRLTAEGYLLALAIAGKEKVRAAPFDAIELDLALLWGDRA